VCGCVCLYFLSRTNSRSPTCGWPAGTACRATGLEDCKQSGSFGWPGEERIVNHDGEAAETICGGGPGVLVGAREEEGKPV